MHDQDTRLRLLDLALAVSDGHSKLGQERPSCCPPLHGLYVLQQVMQVTITFLRPCSRQHRSNRGHVLAKASDARATTGAIPGVGSDEYFEGYAPSVCLPQGQN